MLFINIVLVAYVIAGCTYWLFHLYYILRVIRSVPLLENLKYDNAEKWPKVSIIIPARNESATIKDAIQSRLHDDYPNVEILLIDDRSTDSTSEIIDKIASRDNRVKAIHIKELPDGWLGKLYAMHRGVQEATGEWFLFSDADVHVKKTTLKRVISHCELRRLDHLAVFPKLLPTNFVLDSILSIFVRQLCMWCRVWAIENKDSKAFTGSGSFNLVRRSAFKKTEGFEWLKLEVCDDVALGQMLKKSEAKSSLVNGCKFVSVYFYHTVREMAIGAERVTFTVFGNFSAVRLISGAVISIFIELSPFLALFISGIPYIRYIGVAMITIALIISTLVSIWTDRPIFPSLLLPMSVPIINGIAIRAAILGAIRRGIQWRGTFYPTEVLKKGKRLDFEFLFFK
jgi:cellulose synthase/poly-beta-1,6-N-acetylglucosamine synthase-like glycosyltransferase